jgi:hypothetical protein
MDTRCGPQGDGPVGVRELVEVSVVSGRSTFASALGADLQAAQGHVVAGHTG